MLVNEFIKRVSVRLGDEARITYSSKELISCLNDAISQLSLERIAAHDPLMIKEVTVTPGRTSVPAGWVRFVGQEPFYLDGSKFASLDGSAEKRTVRCYVAKAHVESAGDDLPFDDATSLGALMDYVVVLAGARVGYASQVESTLADRMSGAYTGRSASDAGAVAKES